MCRRWRARYPDDNALRSYTSRALERIRALPGVEAAGGTSFLPFSWDNSSSVIIPEGYVASPGESVVSPNQLYVTPGYLEALRVPLLRGRFFAESDTVDAPGVVIVDERLAQRFWPNADPVGRRMYVPQSPDDVVKPGPGVIWVQVVGVVRSVKLKGLVEGRERSRRRVLPALCKGAGAHAWDSRSVRPAMTSPPPSPRSSVRSRRSIPRCSCSTASRCESASIESLDSRRAPMLLLVMFGGVALLLAALGIYGVLAYQVGLRTREIGIRIALGSDARGILRLVLREAVMLVLVGLVAGMAGAVALRSVIASQLYGVGAFDARVIVAATLVLGAAALLASAGPARRAARVDPAVTLQP